MTCPSKIPAHFFIYGPNAVLAFAPTQGSDLPSHVQHSNWHHKLCFQVKLKSDLAYCCVAGTYFWSLQLPGMVPRLTYSLEINCYLERCLGPACLVIRKASTAHRALSPVLVTFSFLLLPPPSGSSILVLSVTSSDKTQGGKYSQNFHFLWGWVCLLNPFRDRPSQSQRANIPRPDCKR